MIEVWKKLSEHYGFSLIPLHGKAPFEMGWQRWCVEKRKFSQFVFKDCNAGVACGPASNVIVLDIDKEDRFKEICDEYKWDVPKTFVVKTGAEKFHLYFRYVENGKEYGCSSWKEGDETIFDIRGKGGQVVAPGSIHPDTGKPYVIARDVTIAQPPQWMLDRCSVEEPIRGTPIHIPGSSRWDGDIDSLPISEEMKILIVNGENIGSRSEAIMSVVNSLVWANLSDSEIIGIFDRHPIGNKYREKKRAKSKWLNKHIDKARRYVTDRADMHREQRAWEYTVLNGGKGTTGDNDVQRGEMGTSGDTGGTIGGQMGDKSETAKGDNSEKLGTNHAEPHDTTGLAQLVETYIKNFHGNFRTKDLTDYLQSHYGLDKLPRSFHKALAKILTRHVEGGRLERTVRGGYRIVDTNLEDLDMGLGDSEHPVKLPLGLNELVYVEPKEVILVCGNTDAGKTCFALQCGLLNYIHIQEREEQNVCQEGAGGYSIFHFISEMGGVSFRNKFTPLGNGAYELYRQHVRVLRFKAASIADQIQAHSINIIDYLEPAGGDFREIVPTINLIFDKLISGVAIICVQMRSEHPVGGLGVFWRPRLAVGLLNDRERNCKVAKIFKAKNIRGNAGVDEWEMDFWCQNKGTEFRELTEWRSTFQLKRTTYPVY